MHIDDYEYGRIVIDGREERKDVILTRSRIYPNWWRKEGHALSLEDLDPVVTQRPGVLVVGTGTAG
ncbi:MAG: MTH938/NDUFAF3 family protein, partial [Acidimicrobiia bacterium]